MKELQVNILPLINKLEAVLKRGFSHEMIAGSYKSVFKGKGMEFVGFREYNQNDDALLIDWKASLRAHKAMVRVLEEERNLTVFFLLDVSESMLFSSHKKLKCEYAVELTATLSYAISQVGDNVGLGLFNEKMVKVIPPALGKNQFYRMVRTLTNPSHYGGGYNLAYALKYLLGLKFLEQDSIVFIISDFIGTHPGWEDQLKVAGIKYDLTSVIIRDPVDMRLPSVSGSVRLKDPYSRKQLLIDNVLAAQEYERQAQSQIDKVKAELKKTNSQHMILETDTEFLGDVFKFFRMRLKNK